MPHRPLGRPGGTRALPVLVALATVAATLSGAAVGGPASATLRRPAARPSAVHLVRDGAGRVRLLAAFGSQVSLDRVARTFGVAATDLRSTSVTAVAGRAVQRYQQVQHGLPVFAGQVVTVHDDRGGLLSASGETAGRAVSTTYAVAGSTAAATARRATATGHHVPVGSLVAARPTRWLLDRSLVDPRSVPELRPVWRVSVRSTRRADLGDDVLVDARTGRVALRLDAVPALDRVVCDNVRTASFACGPTGYDRREGGPPLGVPDADQAYDLTGATSTWYAAHLGVDLTALIGSDLGDGRKLRSTTNYCPPGSCPLDNAFWSGEQMVYGAGFTSADDVVAHELTHGVTQHTAGLVYWYQSGAINESMSDVMGELVDLGDGVGNDAPDVRWVLGEDLPPPAGGPARDMADPPRFGQPDTTASPLYDVATDFDDNGGVHTDSGVPDKAAYLIADGTAGEPTGAFNGAAFPGIGTDRTAQLYWATLQMLTPGSDFLDLATALRQACVNLAFDPAECATVSAAVDATGLGRWAGPSAPRNVSITGGPGMVRLSWLPPAQDGSSRPGSYVVSVTPAVAGDDFFVVEPVATDWVVDGLAPGVDYTVRLVAVNAQGASPAVTRRLTGSAFTVTTPPSAVYGGRARVAGVLHGSGGVGLVGRRVRLLRRDAGERAFSLAGLVTTGPGGSFSFGWPARSSARWYLLYNGLAGEVGVQAPRRLLAVRPRVTLSADDLSVRTGSPVTLSGTVRPLATGRVQVQRRTPAGTWTTVAQAPVAGGSWSTVWRVPPGRPTELRARVPARPAAGLAAGLSRVVVLTPP